MHYLITGHTGFKGSWLSLLLQMQGHIVSGVALDPQEKSLFNQAELSNIFENDVRLDIRKRAEIARVVEFINPNAIIHLAAQSLVGESYQDPIQTFDTNVIGTLNLLEATKKLKNLKATLIITTDKVYKNLNHLRSFAETDELGGDDPYSASKVAADIAAQSWIKNFASSPVAIARAGNVIGGGDWALNRIIPDLVNAYSTDQIPILRNPNAIRPWQHVLDCLNGYMLLVEKQITTGIGGVWNFGPNDTKCYPVSQLVSEFSKKWGIKTNPATIDRKNFPEEKQHLMLNSDKARKELNWTDKLDFQDTIDWTVSWYKLSELRPARDLCEEQIKKYLGMFS